METIWYSEQQKLKKQVGLFEIANINQSNVITIALNPKEYYERFDNHSGNKKHKGLKNSTRGMGFDSCSARFAGLNELDYIKKPKKIELKRFQLLMNQCR